MAVGDLSDSERLARVEQQVSQVAEATSENSETLDEIQGDIHELRTNHEKRSHLKETVVESVKILSGGGVLAVLVNTVI